MAPRDTLAPTEDQALFLAVARLCDGHSVPEVLQVCVSILANCVRQNYGLRTEAEAVMTQLFGRTMEALMEHYDPTTNRRRSVVPFTQVIHPTVINGHGHT